MTDNDDCMSSLYETFHQIEKIQQTNKIMTSAEPGDLFRGQDHNDLTV